MNTWAGRLGLRFFFSAVVTVAGCGILTPCKAAASALPSISSQPQSQSVVAGSNAVFTVVAGGQGTLDYQWSLNGTNLADSAHISGATNATLTISNIVASDAGNYQVIVSNSHGSVTSSVALLSVVFTVYYVNINNPNPVPPYLNWTTAATNIQDAIDDAAPGDLILVTNGVYQTGGRIVNGALTNRVVIDKAVTVQSVNGPAVTIIQGNPPVIQGYSYNGSNAVRCAYMTNNAVLSGFTLINGGTSSLGDTNKDESGGGAWCESTNAILTNCVIRDNFAYYSGGGIFNGTLVNCAINGNDTAFNVGASFGGGAYGSTLSDCVVAGNSSSSGGGVAGGTLYQCVISNNEAYFLYDEGGGLAYCTAFNCTIVNNSAGSEGGGMAYCNAINCKILNNQTGANVGGAWESSLTGCLISGNAWDGAEYSALTNCTVVNNLYGAYSSTLNNCICYYNGYNADVSTCNYTCTTPMPTNGIGNITNAPLFVATNDFRLLPGSPCIDAGNNAYVTTATDIDGNPRIVNGTVDMGAHEFQNAPIIIVQPTSQTVPFGQSTLSFTVFAIGAGTLTYQWQFDGTNISGATNFTYTLDFVQYTNAGTYSVLVSNAFGSIESSNAVLAVYSPPIILEQPQGVTAIEGQSVSFSVLAAGHDPLNYQWSYNGTNLVGATNATLNLTAVLPSQAGAYSVVISNLAGFTNSDSAVLTIPPSPPFILTQPQGQYVPADLGLNANFSVAVIGTPPFFYQWRFNGTNIPGATQPFLTVTNVQTADAGAYSVLITNTVGPTLSQDAVLSVTPTAASTAHFIPFSGVADFIYDDLRDILYIVNGGSDVHRYQVGSATFLTPLSISGSLANLDLSPDGNLLAIADHTSGVNASFYLVNLESNSVQHIILTTFPGYVNSLAFGKDGAVVCEVSNLIVRYDPVTGTTTQRNTVYTSSGPMTASADGSTIGILGLGAFLGYAGLVFTYNVTNQGIDGYEQSENYILASPELSRDGSLVAEATSDSLLVSANTHTNGNVSYLASIPNPSGFVFSPNRDILFCGKSNSRELDGYETAGFNESFILDFGTNIISPRLRVSRDGTKIFGAVPGGINWINWKHFALSFLLQPTNQTVFAGSNVTFETRVSGSPPIQYQWQVGGISIPGATNATFTLPGQPYHTGPSNYTVIAYNPMGYIVSTNALLTIVSPPYVNTPPQSQAIGAGSNVTFAVAADGSPLLAYQWSANGTNIPGATNVSYSITNVQATNAGNYTVVVTNTYGSITNAVTLTVVPTPPWLVLQPAGQTTLVSSNITFSVQGKGSEPLYYQWFGNSTALVNGGRISGATSATLTISSAQTNDSAAYQAVVTNMYGAATSQVATLTVVAPVQITGQPASQDALLGSNVTFTVTAGGTGPFNYQWYFNGAPLSDGGRISGSATPILSILNVQLGDAGGYRVVVSNLLNSVTSLTASLTPQAVLGPSVRYVMLTSTNPQSPYLDWSTAATNIQDAIDAAVAGDLVLVSNGVYSVGGRAVYGQATNRVNIDRAITVQSINGPLAAFIKGDYTAPTHGGPNTRCAYLTNGAVLAGFTLTNGGTIYSTNVYQEASGGGVWCEGSGAVVSNCVLAGNVAARFGGGAFQGTLFDCLLTNNTAAQGGGACSNTLIDCTLAKNSANFQSVNGGGGAYACILSNCLLVANVCNFNGGGGGAFGSTLNSCVLSNNAAGAGAGVCQAVVNNSLLSSNRASVYGGGAYSSSLINCVLKNNLATRSGSGAYNCALTNCTVVSNTPSVGVDSGTVVNSIVYDNPGGNIINSKSVFYTCSIPVSGPNCFTNAPLFVNEAGSDFHLQSNSPCINSGNNAYVSVTNDLDGNPRIVSGTVDIGAYEFQGHGSIISYAYLRQYGLPTDGSVDYADLDGTTFNVYQDWIAGLDPTNSLSVLAMLPPVPTNNPVGLVVSWESVSNRTYFLQSSTNLGAQPAFSTIQNNIVGRAGTTSYTDTSATNSGPYFYRVGVQ